MTTMVPQLGRTTAAPPWCESGVRDRLSWFSEVVGKQPFAFDEESQVWHFFSHDHVGAYLRSPGGEWSTAKRLDALPPEQRVIRLLTSDGDEHTRLRAKFSRPYRARRVAVLEERVRALART